MIIVSSTILIYYCSNKFDLDTTYEKFSMFSRIKTVDYDLKKLLKYNNLKDSVQLLQNCQDNLIIVSNKQNAIIADLRKILSTEFKLVIISVSFTALLLFVRLFVPSTDNGYLIYMYSIYPNIDPSKFQEYLQAVKALANAMH